MNANDMTKEELVEFIISANDDLAEAMEWGNSYTQNDEIRTSAVLGFRRAEQAHRLLCKVDPTRDTPEVQDK
jgi:hypothetical protein